MATTDLKTTAEVTFIGHKMAIDTDGRQQVDYFVGTEVENTAMKGEKTLFVVGIKTLEEIQHILNTVEVAKDIRHIYLGTSQCFTPKTDEDWTAWDKFIRDLLLAGLWVTLDFGVEYAPELLEFSWNEQFNFIPMISVKLPYIQQFNYNATLKIDDTTWGHSNPGVWCHPLNELMTRDVYTDWKDYKGDTPV
jgi:hypothetical protein